MLPCVLLSDADGQMLCRRVRRFVQRLSTAKVQFAAPSCGRVIERANNGYNLRDFGPEAFARGYPRRQAGQQ